VKILPPPRVPGDTEAERFDNAIRRMFNVSKEDVLREEALAKAAKRKKRASKKPH